MSERPATIVVKIGGSLLASPQFPQRFRAWLGTQSQANPAAHLVLVVGGGRWVDAIRELDAHTVIDAAEAHWACVAIMDVTAGLVAAMLPELKVVVTFDELKQRLDASDITILKPQEFMERIEPHVEGTKLPANWRVTSDSIAARLAIVLQAEELVLLKSAPPPTSLEPATMLAHWAASGYVDECLPMLRDELPKLVVHTLPPAHLASKSYAK
jgi:aspartokinase-like uncharacterized kinase